MDKMIDAAATAALVQDMQSRGFDANWIGKQIGSVGKEVLRWINRGTIRRSRASQVEGVHDTTAGLTRTPPRRSSGPGRKAREMTPEGEQLVIALTRDENLPMHEIIARSGYSRQAVEGVQNRHNLRRRVGRQVSARHRRGDYDWAVVERMYTGHGSTLDPSYPEIQGLFERAKRNGVSMPELARKIGKDYSLVLKWEKELRGLQAA